MATRIELCLRRSSGLLAILCLVLTYGWLLQGATDNEKAHYALVKAPADGGTAIDQTQFEVGDWTSASESPADYLPIALVLAALAAVGLVGRLAQGRHGPLKLSLQRARG